MQNRFDAMVYREIVPAVRADCRSDDIGIITAGASIGAFNAIAALCRHPDVFRIALGMSGTYDLERFLHGGPFTEDLYFSSPLHYLPDLGEDSEQLRLLRQRFAVLAFGQGAGKIQANPGGWLGCWAIAACPTGSTPGDRNGIMTGRPGG